MAEVLVVAFGGNAILPNGRRGTIDEQRQNIRAMSAQLARLLLSGRRIVVTHGNGPQVGEIMLKSELARDTVPALTLDVAGAMSQGQIGYLLQCEIANCMKLAGSPRPVCAIVTQVEVDRSDPAFATPTKPIGRFYSEEDARLVQEKHGWDMVEDAGRGYRRVVPSPRPETIEEWPAVQTLLAAGVVVIAAGGGGIPVTRLPDGSLEGVEAVVDKDAAAERLASLVDADTLVLLTEVDTVAVDFGTPSQRSLRTVTVEELRRHYDEGQFPPGSMGPKVRAAIDFLDAGGDRAIITSSRYLVEAVSRGSAGTQVLRTEATRTVPLSLSEPVG